MESGAASIAASADLAGPESSGASQSSCAEDSPATQNQLCRSQASWSVKRNRLATPEQAGEGNVRNFNSPAKSQARPGLADIAAMLEAQQDSLARLLEAQDRQEAMLQAHAKYILRQVGNILRTPRTGPPPGGATPVPAAWANAKKNAEKNSIGSETIDPNKSIQGDSSASDWEGDASTVLTSRGKQLLYPSEASGVASMLSGPVSPVASLSDFSVSTDDFERQQTPAEETQNLDVKLSQLKESDKDFFFWGLTNSDENSQNAKRGLVGKLAWRCTHSVLFEMVIPVLIIGNACTIGYQADWDMRNLNEPGRSDEVPAFIWMNRAFAFIFFVELMSRILAEQWLFVWWKNRGFGWNVFDSLIVMSSIAEEVLSLILLTRRSHISSLRVVRVLRLVRALRVIRILRFFRELRIMVSGIMNCGKSLLWASLLIMIMTYIFAVVFLQTSFAWLEEKGASGVGCDDEIGAQEECTNFSNFSSLIGGMYTLFKAMSGGTSWGEVSDPLMEVGPLATFTFCLYIMLAVFVVLNVITAIFVDAAARVSDDEATKILDNIQRKSLWIRNAKELFKILDTRREGWLEYRDINRLFTDERAQSCLQEFGIDLDFQSTQVLFNLFNEKGTGIIHEDQFAKTLYRLHGSARSLDLARIHNTVSSMHKSIKIVNRRVDTLACLMGFSLNTSFSRRSAAGAQSQSLAATTMRANRRAHTATPTATASQ